MATEETAVLIPVPEAEPALREIRSVIDPEGVAGVPAHVTLLYPFVPPDRLTPGVLASVASVIGAAAPFDAVLTEPGWFGESVLWLRPEPVEQFTDLTRRLWEAFPDHPPYAGAFSTFVPHLTIGQDLPLDRLAAAADDLPRRLPITFRVDRAVVMCGAPDEGLWTVRAEVPLTGCRPGATPE